MLSAFLCKAVIFSNFFFFFSNSLNVQPLLDHSQHSTALPNGCHETREEEEETLPPSVPVIYSDNCQPGGFRVSFSGLKTKKVRRVYII